MHACMATKSDFAQKLLHDLRLRKERMAASQTSAHSNLMARGSTDAYGKPGQTYRGSRQIKSLESVGGSRGVSPKSRSNGGSNRSLNMQEASQQIVPYGRGKSSATVGDLSMALAFALENGGKLSSGSGSVLSFLHQVGRRSMDMMKMGRSNSFGKPHPPSATGQFPILSHLHIKDISRGIQNINQILRACPNGLNFDRYSIEIGKELLKGAIDLEESLRMLVNLQEASEYMISPQRKSKSKIRLLEEDEDYEEESEKMADQKQLDLPRFSFDKRSKNSYSMKDAAKMEIKQRPMALTYPPDNPSLSERQARTTSNVIPHKRSASHGPDLKAASTISEMKNQLRSSQSNQEKGRISNVVAKLMGLDELPGKADSTTTGRGSSLKQKEGTILKQTAKADIAEPTTRVIENLGPTTTVKNVKQANKLPPTRNSYSTPKGEEIQVVPNANLDMVVYDEKLHNQELEIRDRKNVAQGPKRLMGTMDKQQINTSQSILSPANQTNFQREERRNDHAKHKEKKNTDKCKTKELVLYERLPQKAAQKHSGSEAANILQENIGFTRSILQSEKKNADRMIKSNQHKPHDNYELHQLQMLQKFGSPEQKHKAEKTEQEIGKQKLHARKHKATRAETITSLRPLHGTAGLLKNQPRVSQTTPNKRSSTESIAMLSKGLPKVKRHEVLSKDESNTKNEVNMKNSSYGNADQITSPGNLGSEAEKEIQKKPVIVPALQKKGDSKQVHKSKTTHKIDDVKIGRNETPHNSTRDLKHQGPILQDMKQISQDKLSVMEGVEQQNANNSKEEELEILSSKNSKTSIEPLHGPSQLPIEAELTTTMLMSGEDDGQIPKASQTPTPNNTCQKASENCTESRGQQGQASVSKEDLEQKFDSTLPILLNEACEGSMVDLYLPQNKYKKISELRAQELLTETEKHLKQTLLKSEVFLNTAEALFKLNMPIGILNASDNNYQDADSKLIIDCAYEVTKRKARMQELKAHPYAKISISYVKIMSLDDLAKQLHRNFERLRFYGGSGRDETDAADYLNKMLEKDVQNRDPDVNGMWDCGWNAMFLAFSEKDDIVKDVERQVLNGLLDEMTRDLLIVPS